MSRYLSYKEECERLQKLLAEVSTDEKSLNEEDEEIVDEELISDHLSNSEEELDSDSEVYVCESTDDYVGKDGKTIWHKKEPRKNVRTPAHISFQNCLEILAKQKCILANKFLDISD
ncbi:hypothetical protein HNY73_015461 [Argiope bruennichi]|uniref:Uncharacterized protein n=1 Tax=Argiope bruennichi TaxID=94029 RepID=A0A8T0ESP5_ARGBR|nr:hypothetical protein HNY73_015461 [Argiope bruennichi]